MPKANDYKVKKSLNFNDATIQGGSHSNSSLAHRVSTPEEARKRQQDEMFGSLSDDEDLCSKGIKVNKIFYIFLFFMLFIFQMLTQLKNQEMKMLLPHINQNYPFCMMITLAMIICLLVF